jgi:hypothetical protein
MSDNGIFFDGDHTQPFAVSPLIWERPFERDSAQYINRQTFRQLLANYSPLAVDTPGPYGDFLIEESKPKDVSGGIGEFERAYSLVPNSRNEEEPYIYTMQYMAYAGRVAQATRSSSRPWHPAARQTRPPQRAPSRPEPTPGVRPRSPEAAT